MKINLTQLQKLSAILPVALLTLHATVPSGPATPFGNVDAPASGASNLAGEVGVTGWALESSNVAPTVSVYRQPILKTEGPGPVLVDSAYFVPGTRPDVAAAYPGYLDNNSGWGLQILTNELPDSNGDGGLGNGTYTLYVQACDPSGSPCAYLNPANGITVEVNNAGSPLPFGAIGAPAPGQTYSGTVTNSGWAVTPQPNIIPASGSTINVWVDGQTLGHPTYNIYRSDIATLFPGLQNSNGAGGTFPLNTTTLWNGLHSLSWGVTDSGGNQTGVGSRLIWVDNPLQFTNMSMPSPADTPAGGCNTGATGSVPYLYTDGTYSTFCGGCAACEISSCGVTFNGSYDGTIGVNWTNSSDTLNNSDYFSVTFNSVANETIAGQRQASCELVSNLADWQYYTGLPVFDPTPQITGVTLTPPLVPGGTAVASIYGSYSDIPAP